VNVLFAVLHLEVELLSIAHHDKC